jgi:putative ABC transport system permease protein
MVISHGLWLRRDGGDPTLVGRAVRVQFGPGAAPEPVEIAGVMPEDSDFPRGADVWMPAAPLIRMSAADNGGVEDAMRGLRVFYALGRLREGVSVESATRELTQVMRTADVQDGPEPNERVVVTPIAAYLMGPARLLVWALLAGAALMLSEVSLGDCFALALATHRRAPLATADPDLAAAARLEEVDVVPLPDSSGRRP